MLGRCWFGRLAAALLVGGTLLAAPALRAQEAVLVFAAASQKDALDAVIAAYGKAGKGPVKASYQSSSTLARQIEKGAPADLFISANPQWMDYLAERNLIDKDTRFDLLSNGLVLVTAKDSKAGPVTITPGFDLAGLLGSGRLAVGDPDHVPAGIYAKQALQNLGIWGAVERKLARADNVRAALALVARGETPFGIVYRSDAVADKGVKVVGPFPETSHPPIVYPVAVMAESKHAQAARDFLAFLKSNAAAKIYANFGFRLLEQ